MGLFSRRRPETDGTTDPDPTPTTSSTTPSPAVDTVASEPAPTAPVEGGDPTAGLRAAAVDLSQAGEGPYDEADAPDRDRIDLGGLQVPLVDGLELRLEMDQRSRTVTGANLIMDGSALQVQAFAAPRSRGLWEEVRRTLAQSIREQGGTAEQREGAYGQELLARLPAHRPDGRAGYRPARILGVDGPRWLLRAVLTGPAVQDADAAARFENLISHLVVVRGREAMAPQELIPLHLPGARPGLVQREGVGPLDPLARGPEITEIG
ncbi:DUF3710 domain-containing protein [Brachybacterium sp. EF45031]|uniref:DUF3710 domain-containing protein n=1 Tax=Brachybacterium sillae TaxID=2810536 RepID=UPI00217E63DB|nr:DUF3710 domain-containing protein [Brachybacterium sillae]MCS6710515.1 DUF3710 domain-containing protein [Brachybacterium sillae]